MRINSASQPLNPESFPGVAPINPELFDYKYSQMQKELEFIKGMHLSERLSAVEKYMEHHDKEHERHTWTWWQWCLFVAPLTLSVVGGFCLLVHLWFNAEIKATNRRMDDVYNMVIPVYNRANELSQNPTKQFPIMAMPIQKDSNF